MTRLYKKNMKTKYKRISFKKKTFWRNFAQEVAMQTIRQKNNFKKKMLTRTKTGFGLVIFYILFITFCLLTSDVWINDSIIPRQNKFIFSVCCLVVLTPVIAFACKEITKLSFSHKKIALLISTLVVILFT
ncbi:hypothetical protein IJQ19_03320 [bacterium]|nr:hypothetical protein [bacterium]